MKKLYLLTAVCLGLISHPVFAEQSQQPEQSGMPMHESMDMQGRKGCEKMSKMNPEKMKGMMQMKKKHMQKMETHLANIEDLLKQLLELEKQKSSSQ